MGKTTSRRGLCVVYCVHDDRYYLEEAIGSFKGAGPVYAFVSRIPWHGALGDWQAAGQAAVKAGATVVEGEWPDEDSHRRAALDFVKVQGYSFALIPDGDEIIEDRLLGQLVSVAAGDQADVVNVEWDTYWWSPEYVVRPREPFRPVMLVKLDTAHHVHLRQFIGDRTMSLGEKCGIVHHLSYCGPDERIRRKIGSWSHRREVVPGWYSDVWCRWKSDRALRHLHPTHPSNYGFAERIRIPAQLSSVAKEPEASRASQRRGTSEKWPTVSVCIPLFGGEEDIAACLDSLESCRDLLHEVIVVDNGSPDKAASRVKECEWATLIENERNLGFAKASNQAYAHSSGDVVLFLNSDTVVPRSGLVALIEDLELSGTIAAAGPLSNTVGHSQRTEPTYTRLENLELFAEDLASTGSEPRDTDMAVGFCLAVRRRVLEEVGPFDESFGTGLFEDNDLCHRIRRAGYRIVVSTRSYVHHKGSASFARAGIDSGRLLQENAQKYKDKWRHDLETGFVDVLPGLSERACTYVADRKPEVLVRKLRPLVERADVSLCMIVRDEERVIGDCLRSAAPFFREIVVVDTGSTDRTVEIARSFGARVYEHTWESSFSVARNRSLSYANGKWIFWMDADDTLPWSTGEALLQSAVGAPGHVHAFVVPVQFVEDGAPSGTRVDHVKLFRRLPNVQFEGRIHEQVLPSIRLHGGDLGRLPQVVLHSGYDTSEAGQAKKRARDRVLLALDYFERPGHPFVLFNLGMTCHFTGHHRKAVRWLKRGLKSANATESHVRKAYDLLGVSLRELGRHHEAKEAFKEGLERVGEDAELRFHLGLSCTQEERYEEALVHYDAVLAYDPDSAFHSFDIGILGFKTLHNRAGVLARLGRYSEAKTDYSAAIEQAPDFLPSTFELFDLALGKEDWECAERCIGHVESQEGRSRNYIGMVARYGSAIGGPGGDVAAISRAVERHPAETEPRLMLGRRLAETGRLIEAKPHLAHLASRGVAEAAYVLAVAEVMRDDYPAARDWMLLAHSLNPGHGQTVEQLARINAALGMPEESGLVQ
ncbi:MAG: glycosyltransferase [Armatimonadetes bacterium]|nr:glycosyltransferase [Armatimonadota bacterium]